MKIIAESIRYPVSVAVGVILLVLFGTIAFFRIPVQLTPTVEDPVVNVETVWPGASPREIEQEIIQEQEDQLKSLEGLVSMESQCRDSSGGIKLTFHVGTDLGDALLRVSNRLEQVEEYPADAEKPVIRTVNPEANAIAWLELRPIEGGGFKDHPWTLYDFVNDNITPEFERVEGVATSGIFGGQPREMQVIVDPARLAVRQVTLAQIAAALDRENRNFSGGDFDEGKRRYIVRTVGEYQSAEDIEDLVVAVRNGVPVYLRDIGHARLGYHKADTQVFDRGKPVIALNVANIPGTNIIDVMRGVRERMRRMNAELLAPMGLELILIYDQTDYIESAIDLVRQNLFIGGALAILVLLLYLRSGTSTLVISVAIPISVVGAFLAMFVFGRTLNVISLAGMAFAVGMVVDNSIIVLENIYRHRQMGKRRADAALAGAREVWGAVLASTLTTIAVFIPIVFMKEEVGQLFGDIALAIACAVGLSLIVSITVIPSLSSKILGTSDKASRKSPGSLVGAAQRVVIRVSEAVHRMIGSTPARLAVVLGFTLVAIGGSWLLMPKTEYLPLGNQNFLMGFLQPPPGYSLNEVAQLQEIILGETSHLWEFPPGTPEADALPGGGVDAFFFVTLPNMAFMGAKSGDPERTKELLPNFMRANARLPGSIFVMKQTSLFERGMDEGRTIDVEITGPDLGRLIELGTRVFVEVMQKIPDVQARPIPSLDLGNPEVRVATHRRRAADLGLSNRELGFAVSALVDGAKAGDFQHEGREIDIRLMADEALIRRTHLLEQMPIATPDGSLVTLGSVAEISTTSGPVQINRHERERTIKIQVTPSEQMELERAMDMIQAQIIQPMTDEDQFGGLYRVALTGSAQKLKQALSTIQWNLLLALVITYLTLAALFESFLYPLVIMFSVPLAALGGFLGLALVNIFNNQPLDVLTMMGFIILIGTVVNNAILIVHQSLNHIRHEGMEHRDAIREAVRNRMRPIFMSVSTSVMGMLPLVLFPGAGAELYRGLGGVVIGGLLVSTVFTLFLVPALFSLVLEARSAVVGRAAALLRARPHSAPNQ